MLECRMLDLYFSVSLSNITLLSGALKVKNLKKLKSILTANNPKTLSTANWNRALHICGIC